MRLKIELEGNTEETAIAAESLRFFIKCVTNAVRDAINNYIDDVSYLYTQDKSDCGFDDDFEEGDGGESGDEV